MAVGRPVAVAAGVTAEPSILTTIPSCRDCTLETESSLGSNEAVKESVAGGLGIGVISRHALHGMDKEHGVRVVEVEGFPLPSAWHMVHRANLASAATRQPFKIGEREARRRQITAERMAQTLPGGADAHTVMASALGQSA